MTGNDKERIVQLERQIQSLERALTRAVEELSSIQSSKWWRMASVYWRVRATIALGASRLRHPVEGFKVVAQRRLPISVRTWLLRHLWRTPVPSERSMADLDQPTGPSLKSGKWDTIPRPTIFFLPAIPWNYRRQRPQHLATALASCGWPVFWLTGGGTADSDVEIGKELSPGVWELRALVSTPLNPLEGRIEKSDVGKLARSLQRWQVKARLHEVIVLCEAPYWALLATALKEQNGWPLVYDLIDLHTGFKTALPDLTSAEDDLLRRADLVTATSAVLEERARMFAPRVRRLPNACDPERWSHPANVPLPGQIPHPVIGYFGGISDWFDTRLVEFLAVERPHWSFVLIGSTWGGSVGKLEKLPNVHLIGEQPYERVPGLASTFDAGIIPFRDAPLTRATDPVKMYEMLALGLRVVATPLPELAKFGDLVDIARSEEDFLQCLDEAVRLPDDERRQQARRLFAFRNRWEDRAHVLERELRTIYPEASIVIVTYNNVPLTRMCLESIRTRTEYPNYEVIVIDNGSTDGTEACLEDLKSSWSELRVVLNGENRGFTTAMNQGLSAADGEILVILNNDTVVTRGWLCSMVRALMGHRTWGLVGAVTNAIGNDAKIPVGYKELSGLAPWALDYVWQNRGKSFPIRMVALFCAAMRRDVWEKVGELDERFEVGMFEDDDYCKRVRKAGFEIQCLRDCFVHHWHHASFRLLGEEEYERIYEANRKRFVEKWSRANRNERSATGEGR